MTYDKCREHLRVLLDATDPNDPLDRTDAVQKFAAACSLVEWVTRDDKEARAQFGVFLSYYEIFALQLEGHKEITRFACEGELTKLPLHLKKK
jgi:hypothetical protein